MQHDPTPNKSLGQHWLTDAACLAAMSDAAQVSTDDVVLEIGPGLGTLTSLLVQRARQVIAVEFDEALAQDLPKRVPASNLSVVRSDILRFDLTTVPGGYKVVANIPYYLTSNLIRVLSESSNPPRVAVLLVQKEVAERVAAGPGDMSVLSVTAQYYWDVLLGRIVKAELFTPPPKVDSQILILHHRTQPLFSEADTKAYFRMVKAGFAQRRKTLLNSLSGGLHLSRTETEALLRKANIAPTERAQALTLEQWHALRVSY